MINYGIQMFSIKDVATVDMHEALKIVAAYGYKNIEFAGFFDNSAEDIRAWLDELSLNVSGTHTALAKLTPDTIADTVAYHKTIGCDYIIVPHADWSSEEKLNANIDAMIYAYNYLKAEGIKLGFHNHSTELVEYPYGKRPIDEIISRTELELEPDVFFFHNCGLSALDFCEKYSGRIRFIHIKDGTYPTDAVRDWHNIHEGSCSTVAGEGMVPIADIVKWGIANGKELIVEVGCKDAPGPVVTRGCIDYLRSLEG